MTNINDVNLELKKSIQKLTNKQFQGLINKITDDLFQKSYNKNNTKEVNLLSNRIINLIELATPEQIKFLNTNDLFIIAINNMNVFNKDLQIENLKNKFIDLKSSRNINLKDKNILPPINIDCDELEKLKKESSMKLK